MAWGGIDISKLTIDACLVREVGKPLRKKLGNTPEGHDKLLRWVRSQAGDVSLHFCMEATGVLGNALAEHLTEAGHCVSVENPARIKHFGLSLGADSKTDEEDALTIALYCRERRPEPWRLASPEVRRLVALMRRYASLQSLLQQEVCRTTEPGLVDAVKASLGETIRFLREEIQRLKEEIDKHIEGHPQLRNDKHLLRTVPGVGEITALWILAELPSVDQFDSAQAAAAYCGLNPRECRSGTSVHRRSRLSKAGNRHLRKALYLPSIAAVRFNPRVRAIYDRLLESGRTKMCALGAAMRKLLMICFGVLKSQKPFDAAAA